MIINYSLQWYIFIELLAIITFILTFKSFSNLSDQGYTISKPLGIIISSTLAWLIMSYNGGTFEFTPLISYISFGILTTISLISLFTLYSKEDLKNLFHFIDKRYKLIIFTEFIFIGIIILGAYINGFTPDILGNNKLQEYVYIDSILNSNSLPPENLWLAGYKINYYYFGYFIIAFLKNFSQIPLEYTFNLVPSTIIALITITSGGIIYNTTENKTIAIIGALLTGLSGNYIALKEILWKGLENGFDWWSSAQFLPGNTFNEFPYWSFIVGNIEPYFVSSFILLTLIYLIVTVIKEEDPYLHYKKSYEKLILWMLIIITSAILIISNIFISIFVIILILFAFIKPLIKDFKNKLNIKKLILTIIICFAGILIIDLPFITSYTFPFKSILLIGKGETTSFTNFFLMAGGFLIPVIMLFIINIKKILDTNWKNIIIITIGLLSIIEIFLIHNANLNPGWLWIIISIPLVIIASISAQTAIINNNNTIFKKNLGMLLILIAVLTIEILIINNPVTILSIVLSIFSVYILIKSNDYISWVNGLLLLTTSLLLLISDTIYLSMLTDNNNIFRSYLYTQILILMPIVSSISIFIIFKRMNPINKDILVVMLTIVFLPLMIFTILAPIYKTDNFKVITNLIPNLSGINHMEVFHKPDFEAIEWIKRNTPKNSIILEGIKPGDAFDGRISAYSGRKSILACSNEKAFSYGPKITDIITKRHNDIDNIYAATDKTKIKDLIEQYNIDYIYVGELEKQLYPEDALNAFDKIGLQMFQSSADSTYKLYELKRYPAN